MEKINWIRKASNCWLHLEIIIGWEAVLHQRSTVKVWWYSQKAFTWSYYLKPDVHLNWWKPMFLATTGLTQHCIRTALLEQGKKDRFDSCMAFEAGNINRQGCLGHSHEYQAESWVRKCQRQWGSSGRQWHCPFLHGPSKSTSGPKLYVFQHGK